MSPMRVLDLVVPFSFLIPEIQYPYQKVDQISRIAYTVSAAFLFIFLSETPVYGVKAPTQNADPIPWLRAGLGMAHGTLAELGIVPIVLSGMTFQMLAGARKLAVKLDTRKDRALFQTTQKFFSLMIALILSLVVSFGSNFEGTTNGKLLVAVQMFSGSALIVFMDEVLSKGYGIGSGTLVFSAAKTAQQFVWALLSLESVVPINREGWHTYGVLPSLFFNLSSRSIKFAIQDAVFRSGGLPNVVDITVALVVFLLVAYISFFKLNLQIRSTKMRAQASSFPIKLTYAGAQPILYTASLFAALHICSYASSNLLTNTYKPAIRVLGAWDKKSAVPLNGLAAWLVPYFDLKNPVLSSLRIATYVLSFAFVSVQVAKQWSLSSGSSPNDLAKQFKENNIVLVGKRDVSVVRELRQVVPTAAMLGGVLTALAASLGDSLGPAGWGCTMSLAALNAFAFVDAIYSEGISMPSAADLM